MQEIRNKIIEQLSNPISNSSLIDFARAYAYGSSINASDYIESYLFENKTLYTKIYPNVLKYEHHKMQYIWNDYFKNNGYDLKYCSNKKYDMGMPEMSEMEINRGESISIYKEAILVYQKGEETLIIEIDTSPRSDQIYEYIFKSTDSNCNIFNDIKNISNEKNFYKGKKIDCSFNFINLDDVSWDDVILEDEIKNVIKSNINEVFSNLNLFKKFGISIKRGVILQGPPGTGKTNVCKCIIKEINHSVLYALPSDFVRDPQSIRNVCAIAKDLAPCLLVIEDIDWIAQDRFKNGFVVELMNHLDGVESFGDIITLGTTNHVQQLEDAIKNRPGRFDRVIAINKPSAESIEKMIVRFTKNYVLYKDLDLESLSKECHNANLTGAHIRDLCTTAAMFAVKSNSINENNLIIKKIHFKQAVKEVSNKDFASYIESRSKNIGFSNQSDHGLEWF